MNLLLDTHAFIWWDQDKLPKRVVAQIQRAHIVYVSAATVWEISIKSSLGKMGRMRVAQSVEHHGFSPLDITFEHAEAVRDLPNHHGDPFDRMLIAQALREKLALVSKDERFAAYGPRLIWE